MSKRNNESDIDLTEDQQFQIYLQKIENTIRKVLMDAICALDMIAELKKPPG